ncbi:MULTISPECIES: hypothetical protein [Fulvivirga]|uniref:Uncharacterized protein n=1 Tax=Fulvivirga sediminis TaxID=2803949 RepID=A0A937K2K4_9BACT|nr:MULTISPECIES: hypothetical protein [Fulvivirga]MBL3658691.1 hypothetical protein [Fulvivirga sediminis]UII26683.1 hypothetical protein LVD15_25870 [Fulvivirga maritima]
MQNVVHNYYKRQFDDFTVLVQVNPVTYKGMELTIHKNGEIEKRKMEFDEEIYDDLAADEFQESSSLEFNLYLKGLVKGGEK